MSYTEELQRLVEAKASMRQSIINKGVEVPEDAAIETYGDYIRQIITPPPIDPSNPTFEGLKLALATDDPASYFPVGTEIPDTYAGNDNPLIVAQYLNETNNSSYGGAVGAILIRKYMGSYFSGTWGDNQYYPTSNIKKYLDNDYEAYCSSECKNMISEINIPYYYNQKVEQVTSRWFLLSSTEIGGELLYSEGIFLDYWKTKTGLSDPSNENNAGRIVSNGNGNNGMWSLRSGYEYNVTSKRIYAVSQFGGIDWYPVSSSSSLHVLPACFIAKD